MKVVSKLIAAVCGVALFAPMPVKADEGEDLAKQLANPIASLISVPFQLNYDQGFGANGDGSRVTMNIQPVIPFELNENWNVISRTILPVIAQEDFTPGTSQSGIGDTVQSFFFSPKAPTNNGWIWGAGPVFLLPTATDSALGLDQFGAGITGVALKQVGPWTYGALANHIWDVGGGSTDIDSTYFQPFISYVTPDKWTFSLNTEMTYDWNTDQANVPINVTATKLIRIGNRPISIGGGLRYYADSPAGGADGWGARMIVTYLFPK